MKRILKKKKKKEKDFSLTFHAELAKSPTTFITANRPCSSLFLLATAKKNMLV